MLQLTAPVLFGVMMAREAAALTGDAAERSGWRGRAWLPQAAELLPQQLLAFAPSAPPPRRLGSL